MNAFTRICRTCAALSLAPALLLLGACDDASSDPAPGAMSAGEVRALDDAADMIASGRPASTAPAVAADPRAAQMQPPANTPQTIETKAPSVGAR